MYLLKCNSVIAKLNFLHFKLVCREKFNDWQQLIPDSTTAPAFPLTLWHGTFIMWKLKTEWIFPAWIVAKYVMSESRKNSLYI